MVNTDLAEPRIAQENPWAHLWGSFCTDLTKMDDHPECQCSMDWHPDWPGELSGSNPVCFLITGTTGLATSSPSHYDSPAVMDCTFYESKINLPPLIWAWRYSGAALRQAALCRPSSLRSVQSITWVSGASFSARVLVGHAWGHWVQSPVMKTKQKPTIPIALP